MNKEDAAKFLGVSPRQIERYTAQGRLSGQYVKGATRPVRDYAQAELERLKAELASAYEHSTVEASAGPEDAAATTATTPTDNPDTTLARLPDSPRALAVLAAVVAETLNQIEDRRGERPAVPVADKLLLTLAEAQGLTGLSRAVLRQAIKDGALQARPLGRAWRVTRAALESYVAALDAPERSALDRNALDRNVPDRARGSSHPPDGKTTSKTASKANGKKTKSVGKKSSGKKARRP